MNDVLRDFPKVVCHERQWAFAEEGDENIEIKRTAEQYRDGVLKKLAPDFAHNPRRVVAVSNESQSQPPRSMLEWHIRLMDYATDMGIRLSLCGPSVGTPLIIDDFASLAHSLDYWAAFRRGNHIYRGNEYFGFAASSGYAFDRDTVIPVDPEEKIHGMLQTDLDKAPYNALPQKWHCGRYSQYLPPDIDFIAGEHGADTLDGDDRLKPIWESLVPQMSPSLSGGINNKWGWRRLEPIWKQWWPDLTLEEAYARNIIWAAKYIYDMPNVVGQMLFAWTDSVKEPRWADFNVRGANHLLYLVGEYNRTLDERQAREAAHSPAPAPQAAMTGHSAVNLSDTGQTERAQGAVMVMGGRPTIEFQTYKMDEWRTDNGGYGNTPGGYARALLDLFPGWDIEVQLRTNYGRHFTGGLGRYRNKRTGEMMDTQNQAFAVYNPQDAARIAAELAAAGVRCSVWAVPHGRPDSWQREVDQIIAVMAACAQSADVNVLTLDVEPYDVFWGSNRPAADAKEYITRLAQGMESELAKNGNFADIYLSTDARANKLGEIGWAVWAPHITRLYAQGYWHEIGLPRQRLLNILNERMAHYCAGLAHPPQQVMTLPWYIHKGAWPTLDDMRQAINESLAHGEPVNIFRSSGYQRLRQLAGCAPSVIAPLGGNGNGEEAATAAQPRGNGAMRAAQAGARAASKVTPRLVRENKGATVGTAALLAALTPLAIGLPGVVAGPLSGWLEAIGFQITPEQVVTAAAAVIAALGFNQQGRVK